MASTNLDVVVSLVDKITKPLQTALGGINKTSEEFYSASKKVGASLTAIGVAGVVGIGKAVNTFMDFEKEMSNVKAITNIAGKEMEDMTALAMKLGATTAFTAKEAAQGMTFLGMAGFKAGEIMEALPGTMNLASAAQIDLGRAADIASNVLTGFRMNAKDTGQVVDVLAATVTSSNVNMEQMAEAMKYFAPTAAAFGVSLEEASATVGLLGNAGIQGSVATQALGTALTRLAKPTKSMYGVMDELKLSFFNAKGEFIGMQPLIAMLEDRFKGLTDKEKQAALATLFGAEALKQMNVLVATGSDALGEYTRQLESSEGAAERMAKTQMDNLAGSIELLTGAFDGLMLAIGSEFEPIIRKAADVLTTLIDKFNTLSPETQKYIAYALGLVTAIAALAGGLGLLVGFIPTLIAGFSALATVATVLWAAITGPIGLVIAAIALLGVAIYMVVKHWDVIKAKTIEVWDLIVSYISGVVSGIVKWLVDQWNMIMKGISEAWEAIKNFFSDIWGGITDIVKIALSLIAGLIILGFAAIGVDIIYHMEGIWATIVYYWDEVKNYIGAKIMEIISDIVSMISTVQGKWQIFWTAVKNIVSIAWNGIKSGVSEGLQWMIDKITTFAQPILKAFSIIWEGIKSAAAGAMDTMMTLIKEALNWVLRKINTLIGAVNRVASIGASALGLNIPMISEIPMLAKGGVVTKPTLAVVGEAGPEAVIPLNKAGRYGVGNGGGGVTIIINGDVTGEDLVERVARELTKLVKLSTATV